MYSLGQHLHCGADNLSITIVRHSRFAIIDRLRYNHIANLQLSFDQTKMAYGKLLPLLASSRNDTIPAGASLTSVKAPFYSAAHHL